MERVMNVDGELLERSAAAAAHAAEQAMIHIEAEYVGDVPGLLETLTPEGPYAYTIQPEVHPDGSVRLPILSTRDEIRQAYEVVRGYSYLRSVVPLTELRGEWYTFQDNISRTEVKETGLRAATQTLGVFPSGRGHGITGELVWVRVPRSALGAPDEATIVDNDDMFLREDVFLQHERYLDALRLSDVELVLDVLNDQVATAVRAYVDDTGRLTTLEGKDAHRAYYEAFFDRYEVLRVDALDRCVESWYVFAEIRMTVTPRQGAGAGRAMALHRAEFHIPANDGRFIARIGHGTDVE